MKRKVIDDNDEDAEKEEDHLEEDVEEEEDDAGDEVEEEEAEEAAAEEDAEEENAERETEDEEAEEEEFVEEEKEADAVNRTTKRSRKVLTQFTQETTNDAMDDEETTERATQDDSDEENAKEAAASPFHKRPINAPGKPAEAGVIKEVYLENFMCHEKFRLEFCRNVTFISGANGSGKSAILAAIQICLGANAQRTHRAQNLRSLVREGVSQAKVRVTLLNHGLDGYKSDLYGDEISIERTISTKGGYNGFKLYSNDMKEISRSKKDLDELLDVLNIQVDNPVAVLDQEESKRFLTGKPEDKYAFFMKATDLARIDRVYASTIDHVNELQVTQKRLENSVEPLEQNLKKLQARWKEHQALGKLEQKYRQISVKYAWALYGQSKEAHDMLKTKMDQFQEKAKTKREELSQAESSVDMPQREIDEATQMVERYVAEAGNNTRDRQELETQLREKLGPKKLLERKLEQKRKEIRYATTELKTTRKRLQDFRDEIAAHEGNAESEAAKRNEQLRQAEEEVEEAKASKDEIRQAVSDAYRKYEEVEPSVQAAKRRVDDVKKRLNAAQSTVQRLSSSANDSLAVFGARVSAVHKMIKNATEQGKFKGRVIGPIGSYIKIHQGKEQYRSLAEIAIGNGSFDRFILTNSEDRQLFMDIRRKAGCTSDCASFSLYPSPRYNVPAPPAENVETVASVLNISEDLVFNCLVDNVGIDMRALCPSKKESEDSLLIRENGRLRTKGGIRDVMFLPHGDRWSIRNGNMSIISNGSKPRNVIGVDVSQALEQAKQEVEQLQREVREAQREEARLNEEHSSYQREWNKAKKAMYRNDMKATELGEKIEKIKMEISNATTRSVDTSEYESDVAVAEEKLQACKDSELKILEGIEELTPPIDKLQIDLEDSKARGEKISRDLERAQKNMTRLVATQSQQAEVVSAKREKLKKYDEAIANHQQVLAQAYQDMETFLHSARTLHYRYTQHESVDNNGPASSHASLTEPTQDELEAIEPVVLDHNLQYYEARMKQADAKIEEERAKRRMRKEDAVTVRENLDKAEADLEKKQLQITDLVHQIKTMKFDLEQRRKLFEKFMKHLMRMTKNKFAEMLSLSRYSGTVNFDREGSTLDLVVQKESEETQTSDVKALSGGERSLATVCLLIALGESLETPFRILDEFDVFLDGQVRKITINALVHMAKEMEHRQFIFITPQDVSHINTNDAKIKVYKLNPPKRRRQSAHETE